MRTFIINFLIAIGITNSYFEKNQDVSLSASNAFIAFVTVYILLWLLSFFYDRRYFYKIPKVFNLLVYFIKELLKANLKIAYDVLTPHYFMNPALVCYPLTAKSDIEITLLAILITLTPGTLALDISEDKRTLYFHSMYTDKYDLEKLKEKVRNGFEKKLLSVTR